MIPENLETLEARLAEQEIRLRDVRRLIERYRLAETINLTVPILLPDARALVAQALESKAAEVSAGHERIAMTYNAAQPLGIKAVDEIDEATEV